MAYCYCRLFFHTCYRTVVCSCFDYSSNYARCK